MQTLTIPQKHSIRMFCRLCILTRYLKVKENWQDKVDPDSVRGKKPAYGKRKEVAFPLSLALEMEKAAKAEGVSQSRFIVEAVAEKLGFDLED